MKNLLHRATLFVFILTTLTTPLASQTLQHIDAALRLTQVQVNHSSDFWGKDELYWTIGMVTKEDQDQPLNKIDERGRDHYISVKESTWKRRNIPDQPCVTFVISNGTTPQLSISVFERDWFNDDDVIGTAEVNVNLSSWASESTGDATQWKTIRSSSYVGDDGAAVTIYYEVDYRLLPCTLTPFPNRMPQQLIVDESSVRNYRDIANDRFFGLMCVNEVETNNDHHYPAGTIWLFPSGAPDDTSEGEIDGRSLPVMIPPGNNRGPDSKTGHIQMIEMLDGNPDNYVGFSISKKIPEPEFFRNSWTANDRPPNCSNQLPECWMEVIKEVVIESLSTDNLGVNSNPVSSPFPCTNQNKVETPIGLIRVRNCYN